MRISGLSVTEAIREIVTRNRSIYDCMKMDIINYTALAVKIQPNVERQIGKSVNLNTIVVAIVDEKNEQLKLVAEMPGVEKEDIHVVVNGNIVNIKAERNTKKYDVSVPVEHKVVKDSAKASYKNGILEVVFTLTKKPEGTKVEIN